MKTILNTTLSVLAATFISLNASASGTGVHLYHANTDISDTASLQRGTKLFMNYCSGCHSLSLMRYNRIGADLGIPLKDVEKNLMFTTEKVGSPIHSAISATASNKWFGATPPDLSLTARVRGTDWIYTYLRSFYADETRPFGTNNHILENVAMPDILWNMKKNTSEQVFNRNVRDIANFLDYTAEPVKLIRADLGIKVLGFLFILFIFAYLLKKEYWKDVKYGKWRAKD
jgi:ubiquinol-cytochrome c reductase cytochrome c1 subunit